MSGCKHKCFKTNPPNIDRCDSCGKSYYEIIEKLEKKNKVLRDELYRTDLALMEVLKPMTRIQVASLSRKYELGIVELDK